MSPSLWSQQCKWKKRRGREREKRTGWGREKKRGWGTPGRQKRVKERAWEPSLKDVTVRTPGQTVLSSPADCFRSATSAGAKVKSDNAVDWRNSRRSANCASSPPVWLVDSAAPVYRISRGICVTVHISQYLVCYRDRTWPKGRGQGKTPIENYEIDF